MIHWLPPAPASQGHPSHTWWSLTAWPHYILGTSGSPITYLLVESGLHGHILYSATLYDVKIVVQNARGEELGFVKAHKVLLSVVCPVFKKMFYGPWSIGLSDSVGERSMQAISCLTNLWSLYLLEGEEIPNSGFVSAFTGTQLSKLQLLNLEFCYSFLDVSLQ